MSSPSPRPATLPEWLAFIAQQHPRGIELGLDRLRRVADALGLRRPARRVITVGGTNGKGSTVAFVEAIAAAAGHRVGSYTSPHLLRFNERIRIDGAEVTDAALVAAFARIEHARGAVPLTYFEFATLAALLVFESEGLDLAVLEVGLGGRLDAVNLVDPDVAVVTTVALDHQDWLGADREAIGREKVGIARSGRPLVLGEADPPSSVLRHAYEIGAFAIRGGSDYRVLRQEGGWIWREPGFEVELPYPGLAAPAQLDNAAAAIAALRAARLRLSRRAMAEGVGSARVAGRLQRIVRDGVEIVLDVAHNPQAAAQLARWGQAHPPAGRCHAVFGALDDKDISGIVAALSPTVSMWWLAGLGHESPRGLAPQALAAKATIAGAPPVHETVEAALAAATAGARPGDRILVLGSFFTVAAALRVLQDEGLRSTV